MNYIGSTVVDISETPFKDFTKEDWVLYFVESGQIDGSHHKQWSLDQISRVIHNTPIIIELAKWDNGLSKYRVKTGEPTQEYNDWVDRMGDAYDYDTGCYKENKMSFMNLPFKIKTNNPILNKLVQEHAFKLGYSWAYGYKTVIEQCYGIFIDSSKVMAHASNEKYFLDREYKEVLISDFLNSNQFFVCGDVKVSIQENKVNFEYRGINKSLNRQSLKEVLNFTIDGNQIENMKIGCRYLTSDDIKLLKSLL